MILHLFGWVAGLGSLLYFLSALVNPAWFLGELSEPVDDLTTVQSLAVISTM